MKAVLNESYGPPESLRLAEVDTPEPKDNEVLIAVKASSINPLDKFFCMGKPFLIRLFGLGLFKPKRKILGADVAGTIVKAGKDIKQFKVGDEIYGEISKGGFGEYTVAEEYQISMKPANQSFEEAAGVPVAALTAFQGIKTHGKIKKGDKVLINGASGGVGTYAVQIAKALGGDITAVCSTTKIETTKELGASKVIDYTKEDFKQGTDTYDLIIDIVGNIHYADYKKLLNKEGRGIQIGFVKMKWLIGLMMAKSFKKLGNSRTIHSFNAEAKKEDLDEIRGMIEADQVKPVIDRHYNLTQLPEAMNYLLEKKAKGKIIIQVNTDI